MRRVPSFYQGFVLWMSVVSTTFGVDPPRNVDVVLRNTSPLKAPRAGRLPLFVLPISNSLMGLPDRECAEILDQLDRRGIGYTVDWNHNRLEESLAEGIRIARMQLALGQPVSVNANTCLYSFFDGSDATLHVDERGNRFAETSFGGKLGCPFAIEHRIPVIRERVSRFLQEYQRQGIKIDFIFADWEIDGPIEWNQSWQTCKRCTRCRSEIANIHDFRQFQSSLRKIRSEIQRVAFGDNVTRFFPEALVGNYGTYPHGGHRYWYDYFEEVPMDVPAKIDQRARYREWYPEFGATGYTFAMPVVYTWYRTFDWYAFDDPDYRWFYNMLLVGSNAGQHTSNSTPIIPFVHWTTTAPPEQPAAHVLQFSKQKYQELLWHLLLRGHDTFFLWCPASELAEEIKLVHDLYAQSLSFKGFLDRGAPVSFQVPDQPEPVISGLRLGNRVLVRRTEFGARSAESIVLALNDQESITVRPQEGLQVVQVQRRQAASGFIKKAGRLMFPIGMYELPADDGDLADMAKAGINLVRCGNPQALDRAHAAGMLGWMPLALQQGATDALRHQVEAVVDHPALAVWEGPDEIVWTFTAYSFLKERAGFSRGDWNDQKQIAVAYSEKEAANIMPSMRSAVAMIRQLDTDNRPVWINEAADSDVRFARQYMPFIDVAGCDYYAVRSTGTDLQSVGRLVDRWDAIGLGKPVWMVLQAFSWHSLRKDRDLMYPSFPQSRFMAYDSIAHGATGVLYWGSNYIDDDRFRQSLYALTSELSAIQPFLTGQRIEGVQANVIDDLFDPAGRGVRTRLLRHANDFLLILVNEDDHRHLGVDVEGLGSLERRVLSLLYGDETRTIQNGRLVTRMQPYEVKVLSTNVDRYESDRRSGRDFQR